MPSSSPESVRQRSGLGFGRRGFRAGIALMKRVGALQRTQHRPGLRPGTADRCRPKLCAVRREAAPCPTRRRDGQPLDACRLGADREPVSRTRYRPAMPRAASASKLIRPFGHSYERPSGSNPSLSMSPRTARFSWPAAVTNLTMSKMCQPKVVPAENVSTHSTMENIIKNEKNPPSHGTPSFERELREPVELGSEWLVLADWKTTMFFQTHGLQFQGLPEAVMSLDLWCQYLRPCRAPPHCKAPDLVEKNRNVSSRVAARSPTAKHGVR